MCEWKRSLFSHRLTINADSNLLLLSCNLFTKGCLLYIILCHHVVFPEWTLLILFGWVTWPDQHLSSLRREFEWNDAEVWHRWQKACYKAWPSCCRLELNQRRVKTFFFFNSDMLWNDFRFYTLYISIRLVISFYSIQ